MHSAQLDLQFRPPVPVTAMSPTDLGHGLPGPAYEVSFENGAAWRCPDRRESPNAFSTSAIR